MKFIVVTVIVILYFVFDNHESDLRLKESIKRENIQRIEQLIQQGADVNTQDENGVTSLMVFSKKHRIENISLLLEKGANPNLQDIQGRTALLYSLEMIPELFDLDVVRVLINGGADINIGDKLGNTFYGTITNPDFYLKRFSDNNRELLQYILSLPNLKIDHEKIKESLYQPFIHDLPEEFKRVLQLQIQDGYEPDFSKILLAAFEGSLEQMKAFHESGVDITQQCKKTQMTALEVSAWRQNIDVMKYLIECGADINVADFKGYTPLLNVCFKKKYESIKFLLDNNVNIYCGNKYGAKAFHVVVTLGDMDIVNLFIQKGVNLNDRNYRGHTPILLAAENQNVELVKYLIEKGADVNAWDNEGNCALGLALYKKNYEMSRLLLDNGADSNGFGFNKIPCLAVAIKNGMYQFVDELIQKSKKDVGFGRMALFYACEKNNLDIVKKLVAHDADVSKNMQAAFDFVMIHDNVTLAEFLLEKGFNINSSHGRPYLHSAQSPDMVKLLLKYGADKTVKDKDGMTAYDYAVKYGYKDIADLLKPDDQNKQ